MVRDAIAFSEAAVISSASCTVLKLNKSACCPSCSDVLRNAVASVLSLGLDSAYECLPLLITMLHDDVAPLGGQLKPEL